MMMFLTMDLLSPTMMSVSRIEKNKNIRELKKVRKERKKKEEKTPSEIKKNRLDFFFLTVILLRSNEFEQRVLIHGMMRAGTKITYVSFVLIFSR